VTHDPRYAKHAERVVHLFDGRVVEEQEAAARAEEELRQAGWDLH
jgi:putative ABC transport system ATP-binding protein